MNSTTTIKNWNMWIIGSIAFGLGLTTWIAGEIRLLALAYRQGALWFLGCFFIPFVSWAFFMFNVKQAWKPVLFATIGFIVTGFGYWAGGFQFLQ